MGDAILQADLAYSFNSVKGYSDQVVIEITTNMHR